VLDLPDVTLCSVDAVNHALALRARERSQRDIRFGRTLFVTDAYPSDILVPAGIEVIAVGPIMSQQAYSQFVLKDLHAHIATSHVLLIQWDGYVVHADMWKVGFLATDYIGAPWPDGTVGNGGFSLRSRRLLAALQDDRFPLLTNNEDVTICCMHRGRLESEFSIQFSPSALARQFSFEMETAYVHQGMRTFGFHGVFNLFLAEPEEQIVAVAALLPAATARSEGVRMLLWNLVGAEKWDAAFAVGQRILANNPDDPRAQDMLRRIEKVSSQDVTAAKQRRPNFATRALQAMRAKKHA